MKKLKAIATFSHISIGGKDEGDEFLSDDELAETLIEDELAVEVEEQQELIEKE